MRLIDADALIDAMNLSDYEAETEALETIANAPTIDAVEVVRCKDCKHSQVDELWHMRWCKGVTVKDEHFCADGERKDDED